MFSCASLIGVGISSYGSLSLKISLIVYIGRLYYLVQISSLNSKCSLRFDPITDSLLISYLNLDCSSFSISTSITLLNWRFFLFTFSFLIMTKIITGNKNIITVNNNAVIYDTLCQWVISCSKNPLYWTPAKHAIKNS